MVQKTDSCERASHDPCWRVLAKGMVCWVNANALGCETFRRGLQSVASVSALKNPFEVSALFDDEAAPQFVFGAMKHNALWRLLGICRYTKSA